MARNLHVVDPSGEIIGEASYEQIHLEGLLHREVHVWFYTPDNHLIFQKRVPEKNNFPGLLDATVGGHVELDQTYESAACQEILEETGVRAQPSELLPVTLTQSRSVYETLGKTNHALRQVYAYLYRGEVSELKLEAGEGAGFEKYSLERLLRLTAEEKQIFVSQRVSPEAMEIYRKILALLRDPGHHLNGPS